MSEEAYPEAAAILRDAGWTPHPEWGVYTRGGLVMGGTPDGLNGHIKTWTKIQPGNPLYSADTPDTPEEAARWLVERFKAPEPEANPLSLESLEFVMDEAAFEPEVSSRDPLAQEPEQVETPQYESDGETGETAQSGALDESVDSGNLGSIEGDEFRADHPDSSEIAGGGDAAISERVLDADPIDADFDVADLGQQEELEKELADLPALAEFDEEPEEAEEPEEEAPQGQDRFIGLDDLDRRRSLRIGDTIRYANGLMPAWSIEDDARLATLRNFAMGVSEKRWDDNPANQAELNALETTIRRINEIKNARDAKVEFLEGASREDVEAFVVEADWP